MVKSPENNAVWSEKESAMHLTHTVLHHYAHHRFVVLRKLELAQKASALCKKREELNKAQSFFEKIKVQYTSIMPVKDQDKNSMWVEIMQLFSQKTILEDDLFFMEEMLEKMPKSVKSVYEEMIHKDKRLNILMKQVDEPAYKEAKKRIKAVQNHKNPMTGVEQAEYEDNFLQQIKSVLFSED